MHVEVTKTTPEKSLLRPLNKKGGRNNQGKITVRGRGGGHKRRYRIIDFKRRKDDMVAKVIGVEYDPNRSCHIALLEYADGERRYILHPVGLQVGDDVISSNEAIEPNSGSCSCLAEHSGQTRSCVSANDLGTCFGEESCDPTQAAPVLMDSFNISCTFTSP